MDTASAIEIRLTIDLTDPVGRYTVGKASIVTIRGRVGIATLDDQTEIVNEPDWAEPCGDVYFEYRNDTEVPCAVRPALEADYQQLRVPV